MCAAVAGCALVGVGGNRPALHRIEATHIVHAHDVIGVAVREQNRVDPGDAEASSACMRRSVEVSIRIDGPLSTSR